MSVRATTWAWEKGRELDLNQGQRLTLVRIGDHADHDGVCWPGEKGLAAYTGADESTIRRHLKRFEELGLLHRDPQVRGEGRGRGRAPDRIHLQIDDQPRTMPGRSEATNRAGTHGRSPEDHPGEMRGKSARTNRASEGGLTGHSTRPYIEEPSVEPSPPTPPRGISSRPKDRRASRSLAQSDFDTEPGVAECREWYRRELPADIHPHAELALFRLVRGPGDPTPENLRAALERTPQVDLTEAA